MTITTAASVLAIFAVFIPFFNVGCNRLKTEKLSGHFFIYHCFSLFLPCSKVYFFTSSFKVKTFCKITYLLSYTMGCFLSKKKKNSFVNIKNEPYYEHFQPKGVVTVTLDVLFGSSIILIKYNYWYVNIVKMLKTSQDVLSGYGSCCSLPFKRDMTH